MYGSLLIIEKKRIRIQNGIPTQNDGLWKLTSSIILKTNKSYIFAEGQTESDAGVYRWKNATFLITKPYSSFRRWKLSKGISNFIFLNYNLYKLITWHNVLKPTNIYVQGPGFQSVAILFLIRLGLFESKNINYRHMTEWPKGLPGIPFSNWSRFLLMRNNSVKLIITGITGKFNNETFSTSVFDHEIGEIPIKNLDDQIKFVYIGRCSEEKGISKMIEFFNNIKFKHSNSTLKLIGVSEQELNKICCIENLDGIQALGRLSNTKVIGQIKDANFVLLFSRQEGFPKVLLECMSVGVLPVINGFWGSRYFEKGGGFVLDQTITIEENSSKFYEKIFNVSYNYEQMVKSAVEFAKNHTIENWIEINLKKLIKK